MKNGGKVNDEVDDLFKLPLAEFIDARNALAKRLKQSGRADDANLVKTLVKPSVSAWTVNQLYWNHRVAFDRLLAAGQRFHKAQTSGAAGRLADLRGSLDARREALMRLSELAESLLSDAGHNASPDTIRRVTTTLEAISAHASASDGPTLGRLSQDVDPPGFEMLASFVSGVGTTTKIAQKSTAAPASSPKTTRDAKQSEEKRQLDKKREAEQVRKERQVRIAAAKLSLQSAKRSLVNARTRAQSLDAEQKKANAEVKEAEKRRREAEQQLKHATAAAEDAAKRARSVAEEASAAAEAVEDARRAVDKETKELESLFSELR